MTAWLGTLARVLRRGAPNNEREAGAKMNGEARNVDAVQTEAHLDPCGGYDCDSTSAEPGRQGGRLASSSLALPRQRLGVVWQGKAMTGGRGRSG